MEEISDAGYSYAFSKAYKDPNFSLGYRNLCLDGVLEEDEFISYCLHKIFQNENFHGKRLLDVGCGPIVHRIAAASAYFPEIIVSDFSEFNREDVQKWLKNESSEENWDPLFRIQALLEGYGNTIKGINEIKTRIRAKVKKVLPCDVLRKEIFQEEVGMFDVLLTSLCLEVACTTPEIYKSVMKKLKEYIRPGGGLVIVLVFDSKYYYVKQNKIYTLSISEEFMNEALREAGFKKMHSFCIKDGHSSEVGEYGGVIISSAIKT